jgi:hypothetical protein
MFGWLRGKQGGEKDKSAPRSAGRAPGVSNAAVADALKANDGSAASIASVRQTIASQQLDKRERAAAYRALASSVPYRNQRDNGPDGDVMCNMTSMAMSLEGLGVGGDQNGEQAENVLDGERKGKGLSRYDEYQRETLAESLGVDTRTLKTPGFADGAAAKDWYLANVAPRLEDGATATLGVEGGNGKGGRFRHVIRLQWVEDGGLRVDDPFGAGLTTTDKTGENIGYRAVNEKQGQGGVGADGLMPWADVARMNANKYVQIYAAPSRRSRG